MVRKPLPFVSSLFKKGNLYRKIELVRFTLYTYAFLSLSLISLLSMCSFLAFDSRLLLTDFADCIWKGDLHLFPMPIHNIPMPTKLSNKASLSSTLSALQFHSYSFIQNQGQKLDTSFQYPVTSSTTKTTQFGPFLLVEAAKKKTKTKSRRKRPGDKIRDSQFDEFLIVIKWTYTLAIIPIILYFVYNLVMDPDLPVIARQLLKIIRLKWLSYLGKKEKLMEEGTGDVLIETTDPINKDESEKINSVLSSSNFRQKQKDETFGAGGDVVSHPAERTSGLRKRGNLSSTEPYNKTNFYNNDNNYIQNDYSPFGKTYQVQEGNESISNRLTLDENEPGQNSFNYTYKYATDGSQDNEFMTNENENPNRIQEYNNKSPYSTDQSSFTNPIMNYSRTKKIRKKSSLALGETTELEYETTSGEKNSVDADSYGREISDEERIRKENTNRAIIKTFFANTLRSEQLKYNTLQNKQL